MYHHYAIDGYKLFSQLSDHDQEFRSVGKLSWALFCQNEIGWSSDTGCTAIQVILKLGLFRFGYMNKTMVVTVEEANSSAEPSLCSLYRTLGIQLELLVFSLSCIPLERGWTEMVTVLNSRSLAEYGQASIRNQKRTQKAKHFDLEVVWRISRFPFSVVSFNFSQ